MRKAAAGIAHRGNERRGLEFNSYASRVALGVSALIFMQCTLACASEFKLSEAYVNRLANAIYKAEGGAKTNHPYGILAKYKTTTPRQACINTIRSKHKEWIALGSKGDFIDYLGSRYCPVGASNDPTGLNKNWIPNVRRFLK